MAQISVPIVVKYQLNHACRASEVASAGLVELLLFSTSMFSSSLIAIRGGMAA
jgi:hypothetical protein